MVFHFSFLLLIHHFYSPVPYMQVAEKITSMSSVRPEKQCRSMKEL